MLWPLERKAVPVGRCDLMPLARLFWLACVTAMIGRGWRMIEALAGAKPVLDADGGADYLTYRDNRYRCVQGVELLVGYALKPKLVTKRYVAGCCNSAMYLKYKRGHWSSTFRGAYDGADLPRLRYARTFGFARVTVRFQMTRQDISGSRWGCLGS